VFCRFRPSWRGAWEKATCSVQGRRDSQWQRRRDRGSISTAKRADLVILTLGESPEMSGEASSRSNLGLPGRQQELLEAIVNTGKPITLILFSGRPLTVPWAFEHVPAVLAAWFPGTETGPALVRTLIGESNPSGKLVVSWPRNVGQEPLYYNP